MFLLLNNNNNNNPCFWKKRILLLSLVTMLYSMMASDVCVAMKLAEEETRTAKSGGADIAAAEHNTDNLLISVAQADKAALLKQLPDLKGALLMADQLVKDITGLRSLTALKHSHIWISIKWSGYSQLKAVSNWVNFWPHLLGSTVSPVDRLIRALAVRPTYRQNTDEAAAVSPKVSAPNSPAAAAADHHHHQHNSSKTSSTNDEPRNNDFVKMVLKLKQKKWQKLLESSYKAGEQHQPDSPTSPAGSSGSDSDNVAATGWTNKMVCMQVFTLVEKLNAVETTIAKRKSEGSRLSYATGQQDYEDDAAKHKQLVALLTNIYTHHKDVLAGQSDGFPSGEVKTLVDKLSPPGMFNAAKETFTHAAGVVAGGIKSLADQARQFTNKLPGLGGNTRPYDPAATAKMWKDPKNKPLGMTNDSS